jgi:Tol biopolymer transport system component
MKSGLMAGVFVLAALLAVHAEVRESRFDVKAPPTSNTATLAISPDGDKIVFTAEPGNTSNLWIHSLTSGTARSLAGTEDATTPFPCWAPDSRSFAYFGGNGLKKIDVETGAIQVLVANARNGRGCSWNHEGTILYQAGGANVIFRTTDQGRSPIAAIPSEGGTPTMPFFLPDGRHFLYHLRSALYVAELSGAEPRKLMDSQSSAIFSKTGHLLFTRGETLVAQPFDPEEVKLSGEPFVVAEQVRLNGNSAAVSVSANGNLVYRTGRPRLTQLKWFDRSGTVLGTVGGPVSIASSTLVLSPNGKTILTSGGPGSDILLMDVASGNLTRFTEDPGIDTAPIWSPDGNTIYFTSNRSGIFELYAKPANGSGDEVLVLRSRAVRLARDISQDGRFLLYRGGADIAAIQLDGNPKGEFPVVAEPGIRDYPQFSPDGRWVAFQTNESGRFEVYLQTFPSGRRIRVSTAGGGHARWRADGKELFFVAGDGSLAAVPLTFSDDRESVTVGTPLRLFTPPMIPNVAQDLNFGQQYIASPDGQRFLIQTIEKVESPIKLIRNWQPGP